MRPGDEMGDSVRGGAHSALVTAVGVRRCEVVASAGGLSARAAVAVEAGDESWPDIPARTAAGVTIEPTGDGAYRIAGTSTGYVENKATVPAEPGQVWELSFAGDALPGKDCSVFAQCRTERPWASAITKDGSPARVTVPRGETALTCGMVVGVEGVTVDATLTPSLRLVALVDPPEPGGQSDEATENMMEAVGALS